jgi:protoporphyrinogen oxidase
MEKIYDVAIVGGGISGSAAARECSKHGLNTILIEADSFGGRAGQIKKNGFIMDNGATYLMIYGKYLSDAVRGAHIEERLVEVNKKIVYAINGGLYTIDFSNYVKLFCCLWNFGLLSNRQKLNIGFIKFLFDCQRARRQYEDDYHLLEKYDEMNARELLLHFFDGETCDQLFEPLSQAFLFSKLDQVSSGIFMVMIGCFMDQRNKIFYLREGIGELEQCFISSLDYRFAELRIGKVSGIVKNGNKFTVNLPGDETIYSRSVICAIPLPEIKAIIKGLPEEYMTKIGIITYPPAMLLYYCLDKPTGRFGDSHMVFIPDSESENIRSIGECTNKSTSIVPGTCGMIQVALSASSSRKLMNKPDREVQDTVYKDLLKFVPEIEGMVTLTEIVRWEHGLRSTAAGTFRIGISETTPLKGLFICGDSVAIGLDEVIHSGTRAARLAIEYLRG